MSVMRDSGSTVCLVAKQLVSQERYTGKVIPMYLADHSLIQAPEVTIFVDTPFLKGSIKAVVLDNPLFPLIVGNVDGAQAFPKVSLSSMATQTEISGPVTGHSPFPSMQTSAVVTRAAAERAKRIPKPLKVVSIDEMLQSPGIGVEQTGDPSLRRVWDHAQSKKTFGRAPNRHWFVVKEGKLYRETHHSTNGIRSQLAVPENYRPTVLRLGHETAMAGHMGYKKTLDRIQAYFFWPGMGKDVERYCRSCDRCQRTSDRGRVRPAPLKSLPVISDPFCRVAVDIIGPIHPSASDGSRYILSLVDFATRWPEAVALKNIEAPTVAEAMVGIFSRMGIPREILSDRGTQFTSEMMQEAYRVMSVRPLYTTPYHPQANGLCERMNGTLKKMLARMAADQPREWPRYIAPLLFAYREAPQSSLKVSPFELMFGRSVRGPLTILHELWEGDTPKGEVRSTYAYVLDLEERLQTTCQIAKEELLKSQELDVKYYNRKARARQFQKGDSCLVLLPTDTNKLLAQWSGPFEIIEVCSPLTYKLNVRGKAKAFHINMLKPYHPLNCAPLPALAKLSQQSRSSCCG